MIEEAVRENRIILNESKISTELGRVFSRYIFRNPKDLRSNVTNYIRFKINSMNSIDALQFLEKNVKAGSFSLNRIESISEDLIINDEDVFLSFINPINIKERSINMKGKTKEKAQKFHLEQRFFDKISPIIEEYQDFCQTIKVGSLFEKYFKIESKEVAGYKNNKFSESIPLVPDYFGKNACLIFSRYSYHNYYYRLFFSNFKDVNLFSFSSKINKEDALNLKREIFMELDKFNFPEKIEKQFGFKTNITSSPMILILLSEILRVCFKSDLYRCVFKDINGVKKPTLVPKDLLTNKIIMTNTDFKICSDFEYDTTNIIELSIGSYESSLKFNYEPMVSDDDLAYFKKECSMFADNLIKSLKES